MNKHIFLCIALLAGSADAAEASDHEVMKIREKKAGERIDGVAEMYFSPGGKNVNENTRIIFKPMSNSTHKDKPYMYLERPEWYEMFRKNIRNKTELRLEISKDPSSAPRSYELPNWRIQRLLCMKALRGMCPSMQGNGFSGSRQMDISVVTIDDPSALPHIVKSINSEPLSIALEKWFFPVITSQDSWGIKIPISWKIVQELDSMSHMSHEQLLLNCTIKPRDCAESQKYFLLAMSQVTHIAATLRNRAIKTFVASLIVSAFIYCWLENHYSK